MDSLVEAAPAAGRSVHGGRSGPAHRCAGRRPSRRADVRRRSGPSGAVCGLGGGARRAGTDVPAQRRWTLADVDAGLHEPAGTALDRVDVAVDGLAAGLFLGGCATSAWRSGGSRRRRRQRRVDRGRLRHPVGRSRCRSPDTWTHWSPAVRRRDTSVEVALSDVVTGARPTGPGGGTVGSRGAGARARPWPDLRSRSARRPRRPPRRPLDDLIGDLLAELRPGWERREVGATAALVVDTVLNQSAGRSRGALGPWSPGCRGWCRRTDSTSVRSGADGPAGLCPAAGGAGRTVPMQPRGNSGSIGADSRIRPSIRGRPLRFRPRSGRSTAPPGAGRPTGAGPTRPSVGPAPVVPATGPAPSSFCGARSR